MTNMIQVCSNFHRAGVFIINARPDEMAAPGMQSSMASVVLAQGRVRAKWDHLTAF